MNNIVDLLTNPTNADVCFVAELGINHDGDKNTLKRMIDQAVEAKADAVKFQLYETEFFYNKHVAPDGYSLFQSFYISYADFLELKKYGESKGIMTFASPFDSFTFQKLITDTIFPLKIASGDASTEPWIDELLEKDIPFIISTGSLDDAEIQTLSQKIKGSRSAMLYCVSEYPAPPEGFDILYLNAMQSYLPEQAIGFSDHSKGIALSLAAVSHGAKIIERHFTLFPERQDLDHPLSLSPEQFHELVSSSRMIEKALGKGKRVPSIIEKKIKNLAGRDMYAATDILPNIPITKDMISLQRPGVGVSTKDYKSLIGKTSKDTIQKGTSLRFLLD